MIASVAGPVAAGVRAAEPIVGTSSASAPSATGSSGCSSTVGAMPSWLCSSRATSGSRDEPPTRNSPASWSGCSPQRAITAAVSCTACCSSGTATRSSSSRVRCTASSGPASATGATGLRDSISFAPRTSSQNSRRLRAAASDSGLAIFAQPVRRGPLQQQRRGARPAPRRRPARRGPRPRRRRVPRSRPPVLRTTAMSRVPPPKSKTASAAPTGTGRRSTSAKYRAAATGSGTSRTGGQPAAGGRGGQYRPARYPRTPGRSVRRAAGNRPPRPRPGPPWSAPRRAGRRWVPRARRAARWPRRCGASGWAPAGRVQPGRAAARPGRPGAGRTGPGTPPTACTGAPSKSSGRVRPSGQRSTATVFEVPRSTPIAKPSCSSPARCYGVRSNRALGDQAG